MLIPPNPSDPPDEQFVAARALLDQILRVPELKNIFDIDDRPNTRMVYSQAATIWLLILQRLRGGASLSQVVSEAVNHQTDLFPDNKRVREGTLGENTSTFSKARTRLPLEAIQRFSRCVCDYLGRTAERAFDDRRVFIIDGTTITLPPTPELKKAFPPSTNQYGESVWPVAMLMVAAEMQSGCILVPKIDPMYGPNNSSEAKQAREIVGELPSNSIVLADSGFGIYGVAYHTRVAKHDFLFRLSMTRYKSYRKKAELVDEGEGYKSYRLKWTPTKKDLKGNPDIPPGTCLDVFIHEVQLEGGTTLAMVSSLEFDATCLAELYRRRYDVEFDIRDAKVTMNTEDIRAKSVDMVMKELMGSVVAYNLVSQLRRSAAKLAKVTPRRLSFSGVWLSFQDHLLRKSCDTFEEWQLAFTSALISASKRKLPVRKEPRNYPRIAHPRRPKTTKFQKSLRKKKKTKTEQPPPPE
ncbi:Transposase DDE domain protein [Roseimaritima multifibrata]|uniref:Transposase DDE domain protein n=1 Tax=Roseimaritima multifibrata TaxID=1930274 RepID=A0A517MCZ9_9BACT|nr:IS4 family transposase [Roseimaritima multifibrata]QDS92763.1 Transposase DDE domain protein [Roseimaritima multifibrata]QDS95520.1 Transposase DDE domain protein [Roseimaritima multifibrata]